MKKRTSPIFSLSLTLNILILPLIFSGCLNLFDPLDSPSGDEQLLSAARACFDKRDYQCARELYTKIQSNDTARAEEALMILDEENLGTMALVQAVASADGGNVGSILTNMTESAARGAGSAKRARLVEAFRLLAKIHDKEVRGFVQFTVSLALAAEILAEQTGVQADFIFQKADFVANPSACTTSGAACAGGGAGDCARPGGGTGGLGIGALTDGDDLIDPDYTTYGSANVSAATLSALQNIITSAGMGLSDIAVHQGSSFDIITDIVGIGDPTAIPGTDACYRAAILELGVGR